MASDRCDSCSPATGAPCVLVAGHGVRHCGPKRIVGRKAISERWGADQHLDGAVREAAQALLVALDGYAACRACGGWVSSAEGHKDGCAIVALRAALAVAAPTTTTPSKEGE